MVSFYSGSSEGVATIDAGQTTTITFTTPGNLLIVSCEAGGLFRLTIDGTAPTSEITTESDDEFYFVCDGGNVPLRFPNLNTTDKMLTTVKLYNYSAVTNLGVTLCKDI